MPLNVLNTATFGTIWHLLKINMSEDEPFLTVLENTVVKLSPGSIPVMSVYLKTLLSGHV